MSNLFNIDSKKKGVFKNYHNILVQIIDKV